MLSPVATRIVAQAIINRYDAGEGTVNEIIAANYPTLIGTPDEINVKAAIIVKRPEINVEE